MVRGHIAQWLAGGWLMQALYYVVSGIWPLVHRRSFEAVTGPNIDGWLVKTVGALATVVGAVLGIAGRRGRLTPESKLLAVGAGVNMATIDVRYAVRGRIARVSLLDALAHRVILGAWLSSWRQDARDQQRALSVRRVHRHAGLIFGAVPSALHLALRITRTAE